MRVLFYTFYLRMSDTEAVGDEKVPDISEEKVQDQTKPHHTINQDLDIGTPVYQR